ncbi:MAG: hypothetical protein A2091_06370 [Desulfuromonadales bacterium GWD2_61_12]|nr:MAG: hypothetical protein A2091_06370 [Desulfuromonadales bacterium GWD2_61_12]OGR32858.1 MAG: hypothetical protein A2005_09490 [Desulfuromonadales bacterium GWC2_61_20]
MAKNKGQKGGAVREVVLGGELTIRRVAGLKAELERALGAGEGVQLRLEEVAEVDLAFLQLLCAAQSQAVLRQQSFRITGDTAGRFAEALRQGGFVPQSGTAVDHLPGCLGQFSGAE